MLVKSTEKRLVVVVCVSLTDFATVEPSDGVDPETEEPDEASRTEGCSSSPKSEPIMGLKVCRELPYKFIVGHGEPPASPTASSMPQFSFDKFFFFMKTNGVPLFTVFTL